MGVIHRLAVTITLFPHGRRSDDVAPLHLGMGLRCGMDSVSAEKSDLASQLPRMEDSQCEMRIFLDVLSVEKTELLHQMVVFKYKKALLESQSAIHEPLI